MMRVRSIKMSNTLWEKLHKIAGEEGRSVGQIIRRILRKALGMKEGI